MSKVDEGRLILWETGQIVKQAWEMLPQRFPSISLDAFIVMPNHIHGIIQITARGLVHARAQQAAPLRVSSGVSAFPTLGEIVRVFKSTSTIAINRLLNRSGHGVWQRNYYERIIRNNDEVEKLRAYISENPLRWFWDRENPQAHPEHDPRAAWEA